VVAINWHPAIQDGSVEFVRPVAAACAGEVATDQRAADWVDAADRAERGLGPFATLAARSSFASLPAQGERGGSANG
jgi:hypothetical protein